MRIVIQNVFWQEGIDAIDRSGFVHTDSMHQMVWAQVLRMGQSGGGNDIGQRCESFFVKTCGTFGLYIYHQPALPPFVLRGDAGRATSCRVECQAYRADTPAVGTQVALSEYVNALADQVRAFSKFSTLFSRPS